MASRGRGSAAGGSRAPLVVVAGAAAFLCVAVLLAVTPAAEAGTTYLVGDDAGWTGKVVDYGQWVAGKIFHVGDILVFKYNATRHDVSWVSKGGYRKCIVSPTNGRAPVYHTGYDAITLPRGTHYFICGRPGHCSNGMKLAVTVY